MKVKTYKKTNKHFEDIYTKKKETKEVEIELENGWIINITEHQLGDPLQVPQIFIHTNKGSYEMNLNTLVYKISSQRQ